MKKKQRYISDMKEKETAWVQSSRFILADDWSVWITPLSEIYDEQLEETVHIHRVVNAIGILSGTEELIEIWSNSMNHVGEDAFGRPPLEFIKEMGHYLQVDIVIPDEWKELLTSLGSKPMNIPDTLPSGVPGAVGVITQIIKLPDNKKS